MSPLITMIQPPIMEHIPLRILAIRLDIPNTGYAVLDAGELLYSRVHTFIRRKTGRSTLDEGQRLVHALIDAFNPTILVLENAFHTQAKRAALRNMLGEEIIRLAAGKGLQILSYAPVTVKQAITGDETASRSKVTETIVHLWYHHMEQYLHPDTPDQHTYWEPMFDAVALGVVAHYDVTGQHLPHPLVTASER